MFVYLPRFRVLTPQENVAQFHHSVALAGSHGCEICVFPEQFITAYKANADPAWLKGEFATASARHPVMLLCCGTISEDGFNRQYWFNGGKQLACYEKVHLFRPNGEHELWSAGHEYVALQQGSLRIGLGTCNDVRFPEQIAALSRLGKLGLLVYPALWPAVRDHIWSALLRARAIEHGAFCLGCCVAEVDNGYETFIGASNHVFDPLGEELESNNGVYALDLGKLTAALVDTQAEYIDATAAVVPLAAQVESPA